MNWIKEKEMDSWLLKGAFIFMLLFPAFYSPHTDVYQSAYYAGFTCSYFLLTLYMAVQVIKNSGKNEKKKKISLAGALFFGILLLYNLLSLYFNRKYLHWYWEQINNTTAFLLAGLLFGGFVRPEGEKHDNIRFLIHCIVLSNIGSIIYYFMGYTNFLICNNQFIFFELPENFYESRHYWIYSHKSEYALMLVAFVALFAAYRKKFKNKTTFCLSMSVLLFCLYLTHSWTGIAGVFLIFFGAVLDRVEWKTFRFKKWHIPAAGIVLLAAGGVAFKVMSERDIWSLGNRLPIWKAAWRVIGEYPQGWGMRFGQSAIEVAEGWFINNGHNVFLNQMLRFSIPVGICFVLLFFGIVLYTTVKGRNFLIAGMWLAVLVLMNMDYALMSTQMALLFLIAYLVSIYNRKKPEKPRKIKEF